jgi:hypothetical protein
LSVGQEFTVWDIEHVRLWVCVMDKDDVGSDAIGDVELDLAELLKVKIVMMMMMMMMMMMVMAVVVMVVVVVVVGYR